MLEAIYLNVVARPLESKRRRESPSGILLSIGGGWVAAAIAHWFFCAWLSRDLRLRRPLTREGKKGEKRRESGRAWRSMVYRRNKRVKLPSRVSPPVYPGTEEVSNRRKWTREIRPLNKFSPFFNHVLSHQSKDLEISSRKSRITSLRGGRNFIVRNFVERQLTRNVR